VRKVRKLGCCALLKFSMYNISFYLIYKYYVDRGKSKGFCRFNAALITTLVAIIQLCLIVVLYKRCFIDRAKWNNYPNVTLLEEIFLMTLIFTAFYLYYDFTRIGLVIEKYDKLTVVKKNVLGFFIMLFPLILFFVFVPKV
jgi:hypothetical protein